MITHRPALRGMEKQLAALVSPFECGQGLHKHAAELSILALLSQTESQAPAGTIDVQNPRLNGVTLTHHVSGV